MRGILLLLFAVVVLVVICEGQRRRFGGFGRQGNPGRGLGHRNRARGRPNFRTWASITGQAWRNRAARRGMLGPGGGGGRGGNRWANTGTPRVQVVTVPTTTTTTQKPTIAITPTTMATPVVALQSRREMAFHELQKEKQETNQRILGQKEPQQIHATETFEQNQASRNTPKGIPQDNIRQETRPSRVKTHIQRERERLLVLKKLNDEKIKAAEIALNNVVKENTANTLDGNVKPNMGHDTNTGANHANIQKQREKLLALSAINEEKRKATAAALAELKRLEQLKTETLLEKLLLTGFIETPNRNNIPAEDIAHKGTPSNVHPTIPETVNTGTEWNIGVPENIGPTKQQKTTDVMDTVVAGISTNSKPSGTIDLINIGNTRDKGTPSNDNTARSQLNAPGRVSNIGIPPNNKPANSQSGDTGKVLDTTGESHMLLPASVGNINTGNAVNIIDTIQPTSLHPSDTQPTSLSDITKPATDTSIHIAGKTGTSGKNINQIPIVGQTSSTVSLTDTLGLPPGAKPATFEDVDLSKLVFDDPSIDSNATAINGQGNVSETGAGPNPVMFVTNEALPKAESPKPQNANVAKDKGSANTGNASLDIFMSSIISRFKNKGG